jgi:hypothetical protein
MAFRSSKHKDVQPITMVLNGGLNYAQTPSNLADNELRAANNMIYDPATDFLITRPGTTCQTAAKCDGATPILAIYYYEKSATVAYLVAACNGHLYYLSGATLNAWTEIAALNDTTTVPSFVTFNSKLLVADGGTNIKSWDGTTYAALADSPNATALAVIKNRVVANHIGEPDSVYFSSVKDAESTHAWHTDGADASTGVGLKAGYGDLLVVNAFGVFGDDLMVFKKGTAQKKTMRVNVSDATTSNWYVQDVSDGNATQNAQSVAGAWNNIFFVDANGFKSIKGVADYGDLQVDSIGRKVNNLFTSQTACDFMYYIPAYNAIWFGMGDRVFCYTERGITTSEGVGAVTPAFTDILFKQGRIRSICQAGSTVYLAAHDGFLYKLDESKATDATSASTTAAYSSTVKTKTLTFGGDGILKKLQWYFRPKASGVAVLKVYTNEITGTSLKSITLLNEGTYLYDATGYLAVATGYLYDDGASAWVETSRNRIRATQMAFEILATSGRVGVEWIKAEIALVEGGD